MEDEQRDYYIDPLANENEYWILTRHIQSDQRHSMIHFHAEDADVFCMDYDCEVWYSPDDVPPPEIENLTEDLPDD